MHMHMDTSGHGRWSMWVEAMVDGELGLNDLEQTSSFDLLKDTLAQYLHTSSHTAGTPAADEPDGGGGAGSGRALDGHDAEWRRARGARIRIVVLN